MEGWGSWRRLLGMMEGTGLEEGVLVWELQVRICGVIDCVILVALFIVDFDLLNGLVASFNRGFSLS